MSSLKSPGHWVWVEDAKECFVPAQVIEGFNLGEPADLKTEDGRLIKLSGKQTEKLLDMDDMSHENVDNMVLFNDLNEGSLLHNVRKRYALDQIYTNVGDILVSVNPFRMLPIYDERTMTKYMSAQGQGLAPHVFTVADIAYRNMIADRRSQAVCIAGESGAGKTEAMKSVLQYLAEVSSRTSSGARTSDHASKHSIEQQILQTNPVTESFGNAKTLRNNNSSRFGKWTALSFTHGGNILGAFITDYLLEKSRVAFQCPGERNYHCFYQLIAGLQARPKLAEALRLPDAGAFAYLRGGGAGASDVEGISDVDDFTETVEAFHILGMADETQTAIFRVLAAILHLGNITWSSDDDGGFSEDTLRIADSDVLERVCGLLGVPEDALRSALVSRNIGRASVIAVPYTQAQAAAARDAFSKALYGELFKWLIGAVNRSLMSQISSQGKEGEGRARSLSALSRLNPLEAPDPGDSEHLMIGVLDIFGFETFETNSFEQLCINYCNEKLQYHFNNHIFAVEARAYEAEGVSVAHIKFTNNDETLALFEAPKDGIIAMMDEEILVPKGSDEGFLRKTIGRLEKNTRYVRVVKQRHQFGVKHYAGKVNYTVTGFLEKNKDTLQQEFVTMAKQSTDGFVKLFFPEPAKKADDDGAGGSGRRPARRGRGKSKHKATLATTFRQQLDSLVYIMNECAPQFVRCVKPNHLKVGGTFTSDMVLSQLRCAGLLEVCRVRKAGYPCRYDFKSFIQRYFACAVDDQDDIKTFCASLEHKGALMSNEYQVGRAKVFMRVACNNALEKARAAALFNHVATIQRHGRGVGQRAVYARWREQVAEVQVAVNSCEEEKLLATLKDCKEGERALPYSGAHLPLVIQAQKVLHVLQSNKALIQALENGTVDAGDESLLNNLIASFESVGMTGQALANAKKFVQSVKDRRDALLKVTEAMAFHVDAFDAKTVNEKVELIESALKEAEATHCRDEDLEAARELVATLVDQRECLFDILHAIEAKDLALLKGHLANAADLGIESGSLVIMRAKKEEREMLREKAEKEKELEKEREKCLVELRTAVRSDERVAIQKLLHQAKVELKIPEKHADIKRAMDHVEAIKMKERSAKLEKQQQVKRCIGEIRTAKRKRNIEMLEAAIAKAKDVGVDEKSPDLVNGIQLLSEMQTSSAQTKCRTELKAAIKARNLKRLQRALKMAESIGLLKSVEEGQDAALKDEISGLITSGNQLCDELLKDQERKMARNFIQTNGFGNRDWMGKAKAHGGKFIKQPATDLSIVDVEQELWMVFTHYSVRFNAKELGVMRKDAFMALMRDCNLVSMRPAKGKIMEADMNTIHGVVSSQTAGRKCMFSSFTRAVGKIASKVYPAERGGHAMEKLLSDNILPHASRRIRVSIDEQLTDPDIQQLERQFAPALKDMFQFFAVMPTQQEREELRRHAPREDIDEFIGQSLTYERFMNFSSVFSLSSGTGMVHAALTNTDLAAVFLDSIRVQRVDQVGGLTFEEFWEALSRLALIFYTRRGVENRGVTKAKKARKLVSTRDDAGETRARTMSTGAPADDDADDDGEGESETVYDTVLHLLMWLNHNLDDAIPRAISSQEQFIYGKAEISLSNRGHCLQRGADLFRRKAEAIERELVQQRAEAALGAELADSTQRAAQASDEAAALTRRADRERQLWQIFTHATVHSSDPEVMRRDALMSLLRSCGLVRANTRGVSTPRADRLAGRVGSAGGFGLLEADVYVVHRTFTSKHADQRFKFSSFKMALAKVADKLYGNGAVSGRAAALNKLLLENIFPTAPKHLPQPITKQLGVRNVENLLKIFGVTLKAIFMFFGSPPSKFETDELNRHTRRRDIERRKQSLTFERFCGLASTFGISSDFTTPELAAVFLESVDVANVDNLGGLTFEEFWAALVRMSMLASAAEGGQKALLPVPDQIIAFFVSMSNAVDMNITGSQGATAAKRGVAVMYANADRNSDDIARLMRAVKTFQRLTDQQRASAAGHRTDAARHARSHASEHAASPDLARGSEIKSKRMIAARPPAFTARRKSEEASDHLADLMSKSTSFRTRDQEKQRGQAPPKRNNNRNRYSTRATRMSMRDLADSGGAGENMGAGAGGQDARVFDGAEEAPGAEDPRVSRGSSAARPGSEADARDRKREMRERQAARGRSTSDRARQEREERMHMMSMGSTYGGVKQRRDRAGASSMHRASNRASARDDADGVAPVRSRSRSGTAFTCICAGCNELHRYKDGYCHKHRSLAKKASDRGGRHGSRSGRGEASPAPPKKKMDVATFLMYS